MTNKKTRMNRSRAKKKQPNVWRIFLNILTYIGLFSSLKFFFWILAVLLGSLSLAFMWIYELLVLISSCLFCCKRRKEFKIMDFRASPLYGISNKKYLAELLNIEVFKLKDITKYYSAQPFTAEKNGKIRTLFNPSPEHKRILKKINSLLSPIGAGNYAFGGIKNRSYVMNVDIHKSNTYYCLIDLKNFFPSTKEIYVYKFFKHKLDMSSDIARICTLLTTEKNSPDSLLRHLPQGYSTSPFLSYLTYLDLFEELNAISISNNLTFSCYYDDLTFSSNSYISKGLKRNIIKRIKHYDLEINTEKSKLIKNNYGLKITGAVIRNNKLLAPNHIQFKLFSKYDQLMKKNSESPYDVKNIIHLCNEVQGLCAAVKSVNPERNFDHINKSIKNIRNEISML